jgi:hypothetical protein
LEAESHYHPDFEIRLPNAEMHFVEVKPDDYDTFEQEENMDRLQRFTTEPGKELLILDGNPSCKPVDIVCHSFEGRSLGCAFLQAYHPYVRWIAE